MTQPTVCASPTELRPTEARLRAMRDAVSETWRPRGPMWQVARRLKRAGLLVLYPPGIMGPINYVATPAGRAWLKENDGKGGK